MKAVYGEVVDLKLVRTRSVLAITIEVPIEAHRAVVNLLTIGEPALLHPGAIPAPFGVVESPEQAEPAAPAAEKTAEKPAEPPAKTDHPAAQKPTGAHHGGFGDLPPLCSLCVRWCSNPAFREWLAEAFLVDIPNEEEAAAFIRSYCGVKSRKELDTDPLARTLFDTDIRAPYMEHLNQLTVAA